MLRKNSCCRWASRSASLPLPSRVPYQRINEIVNGRRGITPATALRLAKFFEVSPDFWMNLQLRWDLLAQHAEVNDLMAIRPHRLASKAVA